MDVRDAVVKALKTVAELEESFLVKDELDIGEDVGVDSLARIDVVVLIEKELGIHLDESGLVAVKTVGDLVTLAQVTMKESA